MKKIILLLLLQFTALIAITFTATNDGKLLLVEENTALIPSTESLGVKWVLSSYIGETSQTYINNFTEAKTYNIPGLPTWASLNTSTGLLNIEPTQLGHGLYDVEITTVNDELLTYENALRISVYPQISEIQNKINELTPEDITIIKSTHGTILHTTPQFFHNPDGKTWTVCIPYYQGYGEKQQIITVDLSTGIVGANDTSSVFLETWHQFKATPVDSSRSFINPKGKGFIHIHEYDTASHTWKFDVVPTRADHIGTSQPSKIATGVNKRIYSLGSVDGTPTGPKSVLEVNPTDYSTRFWTNIPAAGDIVDVAADNTYIYVIDDPYSARNLRAVNMATGAVSLLKSSPSIVMYQRKYGVVLQENTAWYWLYNGQLTKAPVDGLNNNPPWGVDSTDLYQPSCSVDTPAAITEYDKTALIPTGTSNTGKFWYIDPNGDPNTYVSVNVPNVIKYSEGLTRVQGLENGQILFLSYAYAGYNIYNPATDQLTQYIPIEGRLSNYAVCIDGKDAYMSGYFAGATFKFDSSHPWDNAIDETYNPNQPKIYSNAKWLGQLGNVGNIGKTYSCSKGSDGLIYFGGERVRSGSGGGLATYNPETEENLGITDAFENEDIRNVVRAGKYIVTSSFATDGTHPIRLSVVDVSTHKVVRTIQPVSDIYKNAGRLSNHSDDSTFVYIYTVTDDNLNTKIIKVDVETGEIIFNQTYPFASSVGGYKDGGYSSLLMSNDGFLYALMGSTGRILIRIDPETGLIEPVKNFTKDAGRFSEQGDDLYVARDWTYAIRKISNHKIIYNLNQ